MVTKKFVIKNEIGLHVRPVDVLVNSVKNFKSEITMIYNKSNYNAKSILALMSACVKPDAEVSFSVEGEDEEAAMAVIENFFANEITGL